jgi:V/A-type H+-transporting ATPase subunit I
MAIPAEGFGNFSLDFILKLFMAALVIAIGHSLQLAMGMLSVVVHGLRLNIMEYAANHLGMMWSGYEYDPFAFRQKKQQ